MTGLNACHAVEESLRFLANSVERDCAPQQTRCCIAGRGAQSADRQCESVFLGNRETRGPRRGAGKPKLSNGKFVPPHRRSPTPKCGRLRVTAFPFSGRCDGTTNSAPPCPPAARPPRSFATG